MRLTAIVSGRVHGVSFRYYTLREARHLGLRGWVRNVQDGTVQVVAEGQGQALELLLAFLQRGSPAARVTNVDANWSAAQGDLGAFTVL